MFVLFNDLIGKKFEYGGRGPDIYDCYGLCMEIYKRKGIKLKEYLSTDEPSIVSDLINGQDFCVRIEKPEPFCFVLFRVHTQYTTHIGVVLPDCKRFIHVMPKKEVSIERLESLSWKNRTKGYYKYAPGN